MPALVSARGLGKRYLIGPDTFRMQTLRDRVTEAIRLRGRRPWWSWFFLSKRSLWSRKQVAA